MVSSKLSQIDTTWDTIEAKQVKIHAKYSKKNTNHNETYNNP